MLLTLIGMSGVGKTFWATRLAAHGFSIIHCDSLIAAKLQPHSGISLELIRVGPIV